MKSTIVLFTFKSLLSGTFSNEVLLSLNNNWEHSLKNKGFTSIENTTITNRLLKFKKYKIYLLGKQMLCKKQKNKKNEITL